MILYAIVIFTNQNKVLSFLSKSWYHLLVPHTCKWSLALFSKLCLSVFHGFLTCGISSFWRKFGFPLTSIEKYGKVFLLPTTESSKKSILSFGCDDMKTLPFLETKCTLSLENVEDKYTFLAHDDKKRPHPHTHTHKQSDIHEFINNMYISEAVLHSCISRQMQNVPWLHNRL